MTLILRKKLTATNFRLLKLADFCRKNYAENTKKRLILKSMWEKEIIFLISKFSKNGTEDAKKKEKMLLNISEEKREEIL